MKTKKYIIICLIYTNLCIFAVFNSSAKNITTYSKGHMAECLTVEEQLAESKTGTALTIYPMGDYKMTDYINTNRASEPKTGVLFTDFIEKTVERKVKRMGESYARNYITLIYHINLFSEEKNATIYTNSVNEDFLDDFIVYLEGKNLKNNYIKNTLMLAKSMARKAGSYGYAVDATYDDVNMESDESYSVYLSMNEITRIYYFKGLSKKQERAKDLFVIGCLTGLRYSDYSTLCPADFHKEFIIKVTKKTNKKVVIPLHDYVKEIYDKYNGDVSKGLSVQYFNRVIKVIMKKVGFTNLVTYSYNRGGKLTTESRPKWEMISSHTARRSAATNMYMTGRMKTFEIMAVTGHTTEKGFFRYIRLTNDDISKQIAGDSFFRT